MRRACGRLATAWRQHDRDQLLLLAALALLLAGALLPPLTWPRPRAHLIVTLDITQSMNVVDQPLATAPGAPVLARLAAAQLALREALDGLPCGSRLGWAVFTEYRSYVLLLPVEVCAHRAELRDTLASITPAMAWSGNSEVAKGLHSAIDAAHKLPEHPAIVFVTDGHESPPLSPRHRPKFDDKPGEVPGLLVGVGGPRPAPIPKTDPLGRPLGLWSADEVQQTDPRSQGRGGSVAGEGLAEEGPANGPAAAGLGATPGAEHLSSLREGYLQLLAAENGLAYHRLRSPQGLAEALASPPLQQPVPLPLPARSVLGALALGLLVWRWLGPACVGWCVAWWRGRVSPGSA